MSDLPPAYHTIDPNPVPSSTAENFDSIPVNPDQAAPCRLVDWNFVAIEAPLKHDFIYFTSHQALQQYKDFAKMGKDRRLDLAEYQEYVRLTRAGFGLPLIESDASFFTSLASTYMKIYRYQAPTMRPFNKHIDRFLFCLVEREQHTRYNKFVMTFTPNPANPDESFTVVMIEHTRIPIVDVSRYKGVKYRWMKNPDSRYTRDYSYSLHALQTNKISLTDGMKKISDGPLKTNPLLGSRLKSFFLGGLTLNEFSYQQLSGETRGSFFDSRDSSIITKLTKDVKAVYHMGDHISPNSSNFNSINAVTTDTLVFLCMTAIFSREEHENSNARRRKQRRSGGMMMMNSMGGF